MKALLPIALAAPLALLACADDDRATADDPQLLFWHALASHCGQAYRGRLVSEDAVDAGFAEAEMVMHVRECSEDTIRVPFHVRGGDGGWDRSRTWVVTRSEAGLRLKHDHRHEDGEADAVTMYGGDTDGPGTARRQDFPVDGESIALFRREGLDASVTNVWTVEVDPASDPQAIFAYQLQRQQARGAPEDRFFRVEFDASSPVDPPPPPWGAE